MSDLISKIDELKSVNAFQSIQVVVPNQSAGRQLKRELVAGQSYVNLEIVTIQQLVHNAAAQHFSDRPPLTLSARCLMLMLLFKNSKFSSRQCPNLAKVSSQFSTIEYLARKSQDLDWYNGLDQLQLSEVGQEMVDLHLELKKRWSEYYTEADVLRFLIQNSKFIIHNSRSLGAGTGIENVSNSRSSSNSRSGSSAEIEDSRPKSAKIPAGSNQEILLGYGLERRFLPDLTYSMLENVCSELFPASVPENLRAGTPTVTVSKASNLDDESRLAVRQVLQWVQEGVPASEIAITFNTDSGYSKLIRNYLKEASLPIAGGNPTKLIDSWAYQNFIDYLNHFSQDLRARSWTDLTQEMNFKHTGDPILIYFGQTAQALQDLDRLFFPLKNPEALIGILNQSLGQKIIPQSPPAAELTLQPLDQLIGTHFKQQIILGCAEGQTPQIHKADPIFNQVDLANLNQNLAGFNPLGSIESSIDHQHQLLDTTIRSTPNTILAYAHNDQRGITANPSRWITDWVADYDFSELPLNWIHSMKINADLVFSTRWAILSDSSTAEQLLDSSSSANLLSKVALKNSRILGQFDAYNGNVASALAPSLFKQWNASMFETYAKDPFKFFMSYVLGTRPPTESYDWEEQLDNADYGSWLHLTLELMIKSIQSGMNYEVKVESEVLQALELLIHREQLTEKYPFFFKLAIGQNSLTEFIVNYQPLKRQFETLTQKMQAYLTYFQNDSKDHAYYSEFEKVFDRKLKNTVALKLWTNPEPRTIQLSGRIDRVDFGKFSNDQIEYRIIDYKSGKPWGSHTDLAGSILKDRKFQLPTYAYLVQNADPPDQHHIFSSQYEYFEAPQIPQMEAVMSAGIPNSLTLIRLYFSLIYQAIEQGWFPYRFDGAPYESTQFRFSDARFAQKFSYGLFDQVRNSKVKLLELPPDLEKAIKELIQVEPDQIELYLRELLYKPAVLRV